MQCVGSNYNHLHNRPSADFQWSIVMVANKTTNYDIILSTRTSQHHLETRAANVWDLIQSDKTLLVFAVFFCGECSLYINWTSIRLALFIEATLSLFTKYQMIRLIHIPTSLHRHILTSHVVLCTVWKEACMCVVWLIKPIHSFTHWSHSQSHTKMDFLDL